MRVRVGPRSAERFPTDDDALGAQLTALLSGVLARGLPRPVLLTVRADQVDWYDIAVLLNARPSHRQRMMAAIAGQDGVEAVAMLGTFKLRQRRQQAATSALVCFIEWPDNRWWTSWRVLREDRSPISVAPIVRRAVDGSPRPGGVGGWFALARRLNLKLHLRKTVTGVIH